MGKWSGKYVQRNSKIGVESKKGVRNSGEKVRKSEGLCCECRKGAMRDDAVWVIAEDVLACWGKRSRAMEAGREIGSEKRPDSKRAKEVGAIGEIARVSSAGKEDVYEVRDEDRPDQWDGAEEEEGAKKEGNAESVPEDDKSLQTSFEGNRERREMDTAQRMS